MGVVQKWLGHSPRSCLPSLAGQMRFPLEERRALGRWGPNSGMPVRYDRAQCVTKVLLKSRIISKLSQGFIPAANFEFPIAAFIEEDADLVQRVPAIHGEDAQPAQLPRSPAAVVLDEPPRGVGAEMFDVIANGAW